MSSSHSSDCTCPDCDTRTVYHRFTLRGIVWVIFCFPCGIYCCIKKREAFCSHCHCEVVKTQPTANTAEMGYQFKNYKSTTKGVPIAHSSCYRNAALSIASNETERSGSASSGGGDNVYSSQTELVRPVRP